MEIQSKYGGKGKYYIKRLAALILRAETKKESFRLYEPVLESYEVVQKIFTSKQDKSK
jgi:hypothetical protein